MNEGLERKVLDHIAEAHGDTIREQNGMRYDAFLDDPVLREFLDSQSLSFLLSAMDAVDGDRP